jgi:hypothetical protein
MSISQENFYRLIKPYDSNLLHVSSTMMGGASKCYKELKKVSPGVKNFSIINTKTNQLYEFDINNNLQMGGGNLPGTVASLSEIELLKRHIESLEKRIIKLEDDINNNMDKPQQQTQQQTQQQIQGSGTNANVLETNNNETTGVTLLGSQKTLPPQRPGLIPPMIKTEQMRQSQPIHQMQSMYQSQPMQSMQQTHPMMQQTQLQPFQTMNPMMQQKQQMSAFNQELARKFI